MNLRIPILSLILCLTFFSAVAQYGTIKGKVINNDQLPLEKVTISIPKLKLGTITNASGLYQLNAVPAGSWQVQISLIGYQSQKVVLKITADSIAIDDVTLQPSGADLNEVIVTGVSRATLAKENPIPIIGVSTKKLEQSSESNVIDVLTKHVPGLNAVKTGPNISKPFIRGLGYNRVLTLYDDIRQEGQQWGDEHGLEVDAYNIDRAEVVKGPSSLIYGSDALAGVVGLIPAMPTDTDKQLHGKVFSEYQSNNGLIGNGLRLTYSTPHWSYVLRGSYRIAKNYRNAIDGRVYNTGFRETNASGTIKYKSDKGYSSLNLTLYDNLQGIPDGSRDSLTRRFTYQTQEGDNDNITARPIVPDDVLNSYKLSPLHQHIQHYRIYTKNHYRVGEGDFDAHLAFQQNIRREYNHPTMPQQAGMYVRLNTVNYGLSYHVPVLTNTELSVGVNGMYQNNLSKDATDFPIPDYNSFDAGVYGFLKWKYERWTIGGGLRYDMRTLNGKDFYTKLNPATGFDQHVPAGQAQGASLQFPKFNKTFKGFSLSLGSTYKVNDQINIKANIARGYRAPSITEFASNGLDPGAHIIYLGNRNFNPEFSLQEDLGIEAQTGDISATLSVFNNNITDFIYLSQLLDENGNSITDAQGNKTYQYQQSKAQLYGVEATFSLSPSGWKGFSWDNAFTVNYGFNRSSRFKNTGKQGEYLPLIPPLRLLTSLSQEVKLKSALFPSVRFKAEADWNAAQNHFLALNNTETATPGYVLFDVSAGAELRYNKKHTIQLQVQVNNLFDRAYQSNLNRLKYFEYYAQSPNNRTGIYNMGRNISFKAIIPF